MPGVAGQGSPAPVSGSCWPQRGQARGPPACWDPVAGSKPHRADGTRQNSPCSPCPSPVREGPCWPHRALALSKGPWFPLCLAWKGTNPSNLPREALKVVILQASDPRRWQHACPGARQSLHPQLPSRFPRVRGSPPAGSCGVHSFRHTSIPSEAPAGAYVLTGIWSTSCCRLKSQQQKLKKRKIPPTLFFLFLQMTARQKHPVPYEAGLGGQDSWLDIRYAPRCHKQRESIPCEGT